MTQLADEPLHPVDAADVAHLASPIALGHRVIPNFRVRAHQKIISDAIVSAVNKDGPRFIAVSIPQQFGKSMITSTLAPAWWLELHSLGILPGGGIGLMSYEDSLAMKWSTDIRRMIEDNQDTFITRLRKDSRAAGYWETEQGGSVLAIGTAGSVQGRPISLLGMDDVTKNFDQAMSPKHQMKIWSNWTTVLYGRLQPWTIVLVTMVRWAPDDFIGRLTSDDYEGDPDDWNFIRIPYVADSEDDPLNRPIGEPLLRPQADQSIEQAVQESIKVRENSSTYSWSTLWQQDPHDDEGAIFPESKWRYWTEKTNDPDLYVLPKPEEFDAVVMSWDMAFKDQKEHDWVVGQAWGAKGADRYLLDQVRGHWGFTETKERVTHFARTIRATYPNARAVLIEDKANGTAIIEVLSSVVGGLIAVNPEESKLARAWACQPLQLGGNLYLPPSDTDWLPAFKIECAKFRGDGVGHDDQVDCMTQALKFLFDYNPSASTVAIASGNLPTQAPSSLPRIPTPFFR